MTFQKETRLAILHPVAWRLFLPTLVLALIAAVLTFAEYKKLEGWVLTLLQIIAALAVVFFWLVPIIRQLSNRLEITDKRVISRTGLFGRNRRELFWQQIVGVELSRGRRITLLVVGEEPLVLVGFPKSKQLAFELQQLSVN